MAKLPFDLIHSYRATTFCLLPELSLKTQEQAVKFVNERGFIHFWPISGVLLPSLWSAVAGDRPVADAHDDPGHVTWGWKDALLGKDQWYYAKILRKKATMISFELIPSFYALSENFGAPGEDYLTQYEQGRMTQEAKTLYECLWDKGPLDTIALRKAARLTSRESESRFERALSDLQSDFKILPVGVTQSGAWHYAFAYDIVARHYPDIPDAAVNISENQSRKNIAETYFRSVGAAQLSDLTRLFGWKAALAENVVGMLEKAGIIHSGYQVEGKTGNWLVWKGLLG